MTLQTFEVRPGLEHAYEAAQVLADNQPQVRWLVLSGGSDTGKTHLGIAVVNAWLERGEAARYTYVPQMLQELRASYGREGDASYDSRFRFLGQVPLLMLDDLGTEKRTDWVSELLDTLIDTRLMRELPLIVTTNLNPARLQMRVASRLLRAEGSVVCDLSNVPEYRVWRGEQTGINYDFSNGG